MDLSIIIPVYNGEKYINRCLNSVLKTNNIKYEIIIINDASKDSTKSILEEISKMADNIKILNLEENKGVSYCRNLGIKIATGEYIGFADIDDYIENEMYEKLIEKSKKEKLDICCCNYVEVNEDTKEEIRSKYKLSTCKIKKNKALKMYLIDKISPAIWDKIFKANILKDKIRFDESLSIGEDVLFCLDAILESKNIGLIDEYCYKYVQQNNSAMHNISEKLLQFKVINEKISIEDKYKKTIKEYSKEYEYFSGEMITRSIHSITNIISEENKTKAKEFLIFIKKEDKDLLKKIIFNKYTSKFIKIEIAILLIFGANIHILLAPFYKYMRKKIRK